MAQVPPTTSANLRPGPSAAPISGVSGLGCTIRDFGPLRQTARLPQTTLADFLVQGDALIIAELEKLRKEREAYVWQIDFSHMSFETTFPISNHLAYLDFMAVHKASDLALNKLAAQLVSWERNVVNKVQFWQNLELLKSQIFSLVLAQVSRQPVSDP